MTPDTLIHTRDTKAQMGDLEQRVTDLEVLSGMPRNTDSILPRLRKLYLDARLGKLKSDPAYVRLWALSMLGVTRTACLELGVQVGDPFVWRWFYAVTLKYSAQGYALEDTLEHLRRISVGVLQVQGLRVLSLGDAACARVISFGKIKGKPPIRM